MDVFLRSPADYERLRLTHYRPISLTKNMAASFFVPQFIKTCLQLAEDQKSHIKQTSNKFKSFTNCVNVCNRYQDCDQLEIQAGALLSNNTRVKNLTLVNFIEDHFDLVMINRYFDESLVLLKRMANLDLKDILYLKARKKLYPFKFSHYSMTHHTNHQQWSPLDYELYWYFKRKLVKEIAKQGIEFRQEVKHFRIVRRDFQSFCHNVFQSLHLYRTYRLNETDILSVLSHTFSMQSDHGEMQYMSGEDCVILAADPSVFQSCLKCVWGTQGADGGSSELCQGPGRLCAHNHSSPLIKNTIPLSMFQPDTHLQWTGWPLMWNSV